MTYVRVTREACCSQDDQAGPLEATYSLDDDATVDELVRKIIASGFLQYSSTNTSMVGVFGDERFVRVFSPYQFPGREPEFVAHKDDKVASAEKGRSVSFWFNWWGP